MKAALENVRVPDLLRELALAAADHPIAELLTPLAGVLKVSQEALLLTAHAALAGFTVRFVVPAAAMLEM